MGVILGSSPMEEEFMGFHILSHTSSCLFHLFAKLATSTFRQCSP